MLISTKGGCLERWACGILANCTIVARQVETVAAMGATGMIIVNSDNFPLMLGALEADNTGVVAVSIPKSAGDKLLAVLSNQQQDTSIPPLEMSLGSTLTAIQQAQRRIQYFAGVHVPIAAFETYWHSAFSLPLISLEDAIAVIETNASGHASPQESDWAEQLAFFSAGIDVFSRFEFTEEATLHAHAGFAAAMLQLEDRKMSFNDIQKLESAAHHFVSAGYYLAGRVLLERRVLIALKGNAKTKAREILCHIALIQFLSADMQSLELIPDDCGLMEPKLGAAVPSIMVAEQVLQRLGPLPADEIDRTCLKQLVDSEPSIKSKSTDSCCFRDTNNGSMRFRSRFVAELYEALNVMGVLSDELGAFNESLRFFELADRLCNDGPSLQVR